MNKRKILVACEESQQLCIAFRKLGYEAYSCDIIPTSGNHPEWHIQNDVMNVLDNGWDLMIAHPPCTYLSVAGAAWLRRRPERKILMESAAKFFRKLLYANIPHICVENPIIYLSAIDIIGRKYDQIINPYQFNDPYKKKTCLWLKNLPKLTPTNIVEPTNYWVNSSSCYRDGAKLSNKGKHRNKKMRSKTFPGIASAMAKQFGYFLNK